MDSVRGVGGMGYGLGSGKSGIWIKSFLYIKFFKKSLGQQIPMKEGVLRVRKHCTWGGVSDPHIAPHGYAPGCMDGCKPVT